MTRSHPSAIFGQAYGMIAHQAVFHSCKRVYIVCLCVCAALLFVQAMGATADNGTDLPYGDAVVVGAIGEPSVLIPMLASDGPSHDVGRMLYNGLVKYSTDLTLVGDLAERWEISADGMTITFYLRTDVVWEDGTPFTAHDVMFGFSTITDP
jgi:peptide/nickel transport system substrate-binding protein